MHGCFATVLIRFLTVRIRFVPARIRYLAMHGGIVTGTTSGQLFTESARRRYRRNVFPLPAKKIYRPGEEYFAISSLRGRNRATKSKYA